MLRGPYHTIQVSISAIQVCDIMIGKDSSEPTLDDMCCISVPLIAPYLDNVFLWFQILVQVLS